MFNIQLAEVEQKFSYKQFLKKNVTPVNKYIGNKWALWAELIGTLVEAMQWSKIMEIKLIKF